MTPRSRDWSLVEQQLGELFTSNCDPYQAGAVALFDKPCDAITQDDREIVKRVFMRMRARCSEKDQTLRRAADMFHEILAACAAEGLSAGGRNAIVAASIRDNLRSRDQLRRIAADGFEVCVRALAAMGAADVTIHECGEREMEEW